MAAPQQFSLRWNNYSQHIVTALDDLRADDELTDVTLSCEGQRLKAHKILLSACSSFFRDTFKENPCKHPIIIIKGVSFTDLEAVVTFMYNGQVNVSQDRLQTFLSAAELLQIKGLTDMNDKEEPAKKRPAHSAGNSSLNHNSSLSHSASRSGTPDSVQRPPSPKRKRAAVDNFSSNEPVSGSSGVFPVVSNNVGSPGASAGGGSNGTSSGGVSSGLNSSGVLPSPVGAGVSGLASSSQGDSDDPFHPNVSIKYEDEQEDDEYDDKANLSSEDNDNSMQDMMCNIEPGSIGSFLGGSGQAGLGTSGTDSSHVSHDDCLYVDEDDEDMEDLDSDEYFETLVESTDSFDYFNSQRATDPTELFSSNVLTFAQPQNQGSSSLVQNQWIKSQHKLIPPSTQIIMETQGSRQTQQRSGSMSGGILKINPQHGTTVSSTPISTVQSAASKKPLPKLVKATLPQLTSFHELSKINNNGSSSSVGNHQQVGSGLVIEPLPLHIQAPSFSITRQLLEGESSPTNESGGGREKKKKRRYTPSSGVPPINMYPHRIKSNNFSTSNLNDPGDPNSPFICPLCSKAYVHLRSLKDHLKAHRGLTRCPACGKIFSKVANMRAHYAVQHASAKPEELLALDELPDAADT